MLQVTVCYKTAYYLFYMGIDNHMWKWVVFLVSPRPSAACLSGECINGSFISATWAATVAFLWIHAFSEQDIKKIYTIPYVSSLKAFISEVT